MSRILHPPTKLSVQTFTMLGSLTFLVEKLSLISNFKLVAFWSSRGGQHIERAGCETHGRVPTMPTLTRGDLLEVPRMLFSHFGIYLGDNKVAHLIPDILPVLTKDDALIKTTITNTRLILGCIYKYATVRMDTLEDFVYGSKIRVNHMDKSRKMQPFPNEGVAKRAEELIGSIPYSLLWNNCEHFVTYCRYGTATSLQTETFCKCLKSIIRDQRTIHLTVLVGMIYIACFGLTPSTAIPTILISFILWVAG